MALGIHYIEKSRISIYQSYKTQTPAAYQAPSHAVLNSSLRLIAQNQFVVMIFEQEIRMTKRTLWSSLYTINYFVPQEWQISRLSYEYDSEPFGKERDAAIQKLASEAGVEVMVRISHTLYDLAK